MGPTGRNPGEGELWEGDLLLGGNEFDLVQDGPPVAWLDVADLAIPRLVAMRLLGR